ncbi:hypothetical protein [Glycomyces algeriensis]|uniref:ApeA N-terminal domain-containing protein n=1 Tax=Glycomyces algeriensis TaxID=256037 RepID=A0A9W6LGX5_9ACTN|nr:hypothetical protein [Glycomyces algeriensis]MDA1364989.1 hypothetical protein [Glycomyces algeriensis]MDR7349950.1 hypothetical protein [Glycomyces algeriensis]GLI42660.1 hypothetical protein GALLR39Z86_25100 [Glycomyces algeriensis]
MANTLEPSEVRTGHLIDPKSGIPFQTCTLRHEPGQGVLLSIPYLNGDPQFAKIENWFSNQDPPKSLIYRDDKGSVTLSGVRWRGHGHFGYTLGRLGADVAIFEYPRQLKNEYKLARVQSRIDGLNEFSRFQSINHVGSFEDGVYKSVVTVKAVEKMVVRHGGFTYIFRAVVPGENRHSVSGSRFSAKSDTVIETNKSRGATMDEHIVAQWPIRALLILAHGSEQYWREHKILDDQFPVWMISGEIKGPMYVPVRFRRTIRDTEQPERLDGDNSFPAFQLQDLGTRGLLRWLKLYDDENFRRAIEPVVEVINGASNFLEPQVLMTVMGLEAMGYFRNPKKASLEAHVKRCVEATRVNWSDIGRKSGIAQAIARVNNDLKHPDRQARPNGLELNLIASLSKTIMRLQMIELLGLPKSQYERISNSMGVIHTKELFRLNGVRITSGGNFVDTP